MRDADEGFALSQATLDYQTAHGKHADEALCMVCKEPLQVGDRVFWDAAQSLREPTPMFHARHWRERHAS